MDDVRLSLYDRYVSSFKQDHGSDYGNPFPDTRWYEFSRRRHYEYLYLPLMNGLASGAPVLELGCGPGDMLEFLREKGYTNVRGIDVSKEQVEIARGRNLEAEVADVFDYLRSQDARWQAIVAKDFVEHFTREELLELGSQIYEALEEGGRLILETPNGRGLFPGQVMYGDLTHQTILTPQSLAQLLKPFGFSDFQFHEAGPTPTYPFGILRVAGWKMIKAGANLARLIEQGKSQKLWTENMICVCRK